MNLRKCLPSEESDQLPLLHSLIRIFTGQIFYCQGCKVSSCGQQRISSDCTDMSPRWVSMSEDTFSHVVVHAIHVPPCRQVYAIQCLFFQTHTCLKASRIISIRILVLFKNLQRKLLLPPQVCIFLMSLMQLTLLFCLDWAVFYDGNLSRVYHSWVYLIKTRVM